MADISTIYSDIDAIDSEVSNQFDQLEIARTMLLNKAAGGGEDLFAKFCNNEMTSYSSDEVRGIPQYAFYFNGALTNISCPSCTSIGAYAFQNCRNLSFVYFPLVQTIGNYAFSSSPITSMQFSGVKTLGNYAFNNTPIAGDIVLPNLTTFGTASFIKTGITSVDVYKNARLTDQLFSGCTNLTRVILRSTTVCQLQYTSAFNNTPFAVGGTGGTVYVPAALIDSYKAATNWKTLFEAGTCNFVALEGSAFE